MKITHVSIGPTKQAEAANAPTLTPELLAATAARYSRSNEGLDHILGRIDPADPDRSVDSIFRMVDYGHQSIADMAPVAMFMDGLSMHLAYCVWAACPLAGGQESSTRYIDLAPALLPDPGALGISPGVHPVWREAMDRAFAAYRRALQLWQDAAAADPSEALAKPFRGSPQVRPPFKNPALFPHLEGEAVPSRCFSKGFASASSVMRIPDGLPADTDEKARRKADRMARNYAFDRARYFLPAAALTNMALVMSARGWVQLCQFLCSHPLAEARTLGDGVRGQLALCAPRLLRHAEAKNSIRAGLTGELGAAAALAAGPWPETLSGGPPRPSAQAPGAFLDAWPPAGVRGADFAADLALHDNRYAWVGAGLRRTAVRFGWQAVTFAELRDLNRHRTGSKHAPAVPVGFYAADDQVPPAADALRGELAALGEVGRDLSARARRALAAGESTAPYWSLLGTQVAFEHITTADKFLYEAELRTGTGSHYRYTAHLRDALALWYERYPETRGLVLEGAAEPE